MSIITISDDLAEWVVQFSGHIPGSDPKTALKEYLYGDRLPAEERRNREMSAGDVLLAMFLSASVERIVNK